MHVARRSEALPSEIRQHSLAKHFGKRPDKLGTSEIIEYQNWLREKKASFSAFNQVVAVLRFLYS